MTAPTSTICPACGAAGEGNFCSSCGTSLRERHCPTCRAELSPQARFCHRCGRAVAASPGGAGAPAAGGRSDRAAWAFAGTMCLLLVGAIIYQVTSGDPTPVRPDMANAGNVGSLPGGPAGPAPDISQMTPRERFDRLFNRIMQAAERGDSAEVERFTPMALGAYGQLADPNADARYHAAVLHLQVGDAPAALALADTILAEQPGHLFGYIVRGEAARLLGDAAARDRAARDFLAHYDAEMGANRVEYLEHRPVVEEFRAAAGGDPTPARR